MNKIAKIALTLVGALNIWLGESYATSLELYEHEDNFNPDIFYLVDQIGGNFLFRGNMPQMDGNFDDFDLNNSIVTTLAHQGIILPCGYHLLDISFLNEETEEKEIEVEVNWFKQNPAMGSFRLHSLYGTCFNPLDFPSCLRDFILEHYDVDRLKTLIAEIRSLLEKQSCTNLIIYMHCNAGKDRTGEASACYLMQHKGYSYEDAMALDEKIAGKPIRDQELNATRWYAFYLRDILGIPTIGIID